VVELDLGKLQVKFIGEATATGPVSPRCYTLTHSDRTGHLFLSIGTRYDEAALSGWYTRLMRDEVMAAYQLDGEVSNFMYTVMSAVDLWSVLQAGA